MTSIDLSDNNIDPIIPGQEWFVCSFVTPKYVKNAVRVIKTKGKEKPEIDMQVVTAFKFRGAFATEEEARKRAKMLQSIDPIHNICIGNSFQWFLLDPSPEHIGDVVYHEEKLNEIMQGQKDEFERAKQFELERRKKSIQEAAKSVKVDDKEVEAKVNEEVKDINDIIDEYSKKESVKKSLEDDLEKLKELL